MHIQICATNKWPYIRRVVFCSVIDLSRASEHLPGAQDGLAGNAVQTA